VRAGNALGPPPSFGQPPDVLDRARQSMLSESNLQAGCYLPGALSNNTAFSLLCRAVNRVSPGHDRRLVIRELLVFGQFAVKAPNRDANEPANCDHHQYCAEEQEPKKREHGSKLHAAHL
jgi:hypothetical protein